MKIDNGKILTYFMNNYNPISLVSYADIRYSIGTLYEQNNFKLVGNSRPNYYYVNSNGIPLRYSRQKFQKYKLEKLLEKYDKNKSEWENMLENGYDRIWDCGNLVYSLEVIK
jgi:hypothetical protein